MWFLPYGTLQLGHRIVHYSARIPHDQLLHRLTADNRISKIGIVLLVTYVNTTVSNFTNWILSMVTIYIIVYVYPRRIVMKLTFVELTAAENSYEIDIR